MRGFSIFFFFFFSIYLCAQSSNGVIYKHFKTNDNQTLAYHQSGKKDTSLIFIHGWCCNQKFWKNQIESFTDRYNIITMDMIGFGLSSKEREAWTVEGFGNDIASVINQLDLNTIILIGHSAGSFYTLSAASQLDGKVIALISVDGFRITYNSYLERRFDAEFFANRDQNFPVDFAESLTESVERWVGSSTTPELKKWIVKEMQNTPSEIAKHTSNMYYRYRNGALQKNLKSVGSTIPIIEISAQDSGSIALDHIRSYAPLFEVEYQKNVGHFPMLEDADAFNNILIDQIQLLSK